MKKILTFLALLSLFFSEAQVKLNGTIKSKLTKEPLPGAVLYFPDLKNGTSSKADGTFEINNLPSAKVLLQVKLIGYKTVVRMIDLQMVSFIDFELEESVVEAEEIVVTGTSHATEIKRNPVPMVSIDQKYLQQNTATNIIDAIVKVPGMSAVTTGPNISKPYIRGLGISRVLTLFDGVRQDGQQWGDEHGIEIDQYLIDRIEVVKGPASLIYGSDAMAGVINMLPANTLPEGTIKGNVLGDYQTNNKQIAGSFNIAGNIKGFSWGARASKKIAADYQNKFDGRVYGTKYNETDINAFAGLNKSWGYTQLNFSYYDNLQEVPDGARDSASRKFVKQVSEKDTLRPIVSESDLNSYKIGTIHQRVKHLRAFSSSNFFIKKSKLAFKAGFQQSTRQEFAHPLYPDLPGLDLILNTANYDLKYYFPEKKGFEFVVGVNGMYQQNKNSNATEFVIPDYNSFDAGPFAYLKKSFGKLDLAAGARYDNRNFRSLNLYTKKDALSGFDSQVNFNPNDSTINKHFTSYINTFSGFSGSFGGTYNFSEKFCIKTNIGRGFRAPNISEISAGGIHPGTGLFQSGDNNLKPEFNLQEDIGLFFDSEHFSGSVEAFNNIISNYIFNERLSANNGTDSTYFQNGNYYPVYKFKQTTAQLYGGEISFDIHPHPFDWLHFENSVSMIYAANLGGDGVKITDSTKYLPLIPPLHTNTELRAETKKKKGFFSGIFIKIGMQYFAEQNRVFSAYHTETKTPGYLLFNAGLGSNIIDKKGNTIFTIVINGSNITDVTYQNNMSRLKYFDNYPVNGTGRSGIYSMGRNVSFKILVPLNIKK